MKIKTTHWAGYLALFTLLISPAVSASTILLGPISYQSFADSPFSGATPDTFFLEDFEDGLFNTPGVSGVANTPGVSLAVAGPGSFTDSVDADDGAIDGSGQGGHSLVGSPNVSAEHLGFTFTFDALVLGMLPTHVGIVWTDGGASIATQFEAFDVNGASLGVIGPVPGADGSFAGTTSEDRFFGIIHDGGIASFTIRDPFGSGNMEVDHLQYGFNTSLAVPEPLSIAILGLGLAGLGLGRKRRIT